ncbi:MAG: T9SS type A sorting domain-containing protein [Bacteroidales bacterium]|nr:T9SS type A sorting domain-containing protein [Bacteroidales bacterium]
MKKNLLILILIFISSFSFTQDFPNPYNVDDLWGVTFNPYEPDYYDGEYDISITALHWYADYCNYAKSFKVEAVSFPFIPTCYPGCIGTTGRTFNVIDNDYGDITFDEWTGKGWDWNEWIIFSELDIHPLEQQSGNYMALLSTAFVTYLPSQSRVLLPHTVIKHTIYIHEFTSHDDNIVDSLVWIYDNTRGRMKFYPFYRSNVSQAGNPGRFDVMFNPKINCDEGGHLWWGEVSNDNWYNSPPLTYNNGSINYFPKIDNKPPPFYPLNNCNFLLYNCVGIHPPEYSLLFSPLRNSNGSAYAGFDNQGHYNTNNSGSYYIDEGIEHVYDIQTAIDLTIINPSEKIIYNPSRCIISTNDPLIFPSGYKFLTVHGKYPDRNDVDYWNVNYWIPQGFNFEDLRDVPVPSDELSEYHITGTLYIHPNVIIMDVIFTGTGTIYYNPELTYGNFVIVDGVNVVETDWNAVQKPPHRKSAQINEIEETKASYLNIYPNPANNMIYLDIVTNSNISSEVQIYNSLGKLIKELHIKNNNKTIVLEDKLPTGIYLVLLNINGEQIDIKKLIIK